MDPLTKSEKTFLECFRIVGKRPYLGFLAAGAMFFIGSALYSSGMQNDQPGRILLAGVCFGGSFFEIVESYLVFRLYAILEKMSRFAS